MVWNQNDMETVKPPPHFKNMQQRGSVLLDFIVGKFLCIHVYYFVDFCGSVWCSSLERIQLEGRMLLFRKPVESKQTGAQTIFLLYSCFG